MDFPFGKRSYRVKRVGDEVVTPDNVSNTPSSDQAGASTSTQPLDEFLRGHRTQPYSVRRTEMVVGGRGRRVNLSYMETLLASSSPSPLSSLPTPAQLCRTRSGGQRTERKRTVSKRDDRPDIHDHLAHLHRKQRQCQLENAVVHVPAQEVPTSPRQDLPSEESTLTFHGRTPFKTSSMQYDEIELDSLRPSATVGSTMASLQLNSGNEDREKHAFRAALFQRSGSGIRASGSSLHAEQRESEDSELERELGLEQELELEQATLRVIGSEMDCEMREERHILGRHVGGLEEPGFRPVGGLEKQWLARQAHAQFQEQCGRGRGRGTRDRGDSLDWMRGGLRIHLPVKEHFEGVPFQGAGDEEPMPALRRTGGFAEILLCPLHPEFSPSPLPPGNRAPLPRDKDTLPRDKDTLPGTGSSTFEHMMELCSFDPETFSIRNHFPREE